MEPRPQIRTQRSSRRLAAVVVMVIMMLGLSAVAGAGGGGGGGGKTKKVKATPTDKWKPLHTYIGKGTTVRWTNPTSEVHDLAAYGGGWNFSENLNPGQDAQRKFKKKGTFKYRCVRHSGIVGGSCQGMCGLIHVFNN